MYKCLTKILIGIAIILYVSETENSVQNLGCDDKKMDFEETLSSSETSGNDLLTFPKNSEALMQFNVKVDNTIIESCELEAIHIGEKAYTYDQ